MTSSASAVLGTYSAVASRLTPVPLEQRRKFLDLPPEGQAHTQAHGTIRAFREIEVGGAAQKAPSTGPVRVAAWNLERGLYPDVAARVLRRHGVTLSLLTELDFGMLRTGQRHTISDIAGVLGGRYVYGLEFLELVPMPPPDGFPVIGGDNEAGFHGNGIVAAVDIENPAVIRLAEAADWFISPKGGQRRIGNRMATAVTVISGSLRFVACSVHLESATDGTGRGTQFAGLLDALDGYANGLSILIGGDLNTHVGPGGQDNPSEPLFSMGRERGYDFNACNLAKPTTRTSIWSESEGTRQLDWFCTRGLRASDPEVVPALGPDGTVLTDHELILVTIS